MEKVKLEFDTTTVSEIYYILNSYQKFQKCKNPNYISSNRCKRMDEALEYMVTEKRKVVEHNLQFREKKKEVFSKLLEKYTLEEIEKL